MSWLAKVTVFCCASAKPVMASAAVAAPAFSIHRFCIFIANFSMVRAISVEDLDQRTLAVLTLADLLSHSRFWLNRLKAASRGSKSFLSGS